MRTLKMAMDAAAVQGRGHRQTTVGYPRGSLRLPPLLAP